MNDVLLTLLGNAFNLAHSIAPPTPKRPYRWNSIPIAVSNSPIKHQKISQDRGLDTGNRPPHPPARKKKKQTFKFQWP